MDRNYLRLVAVLMTLGFVNIIHAAEFLIVSPIPEDYKKVDIYLFETSLNTKTYTNITGPSLQLAYGLLPNIEVDLQLTYAFYHPSISGMSSANGISDTSVFGTWRFLQESKYIPQLAFEPMYTMPAGDYKKGLGNGKPILNLPVYGRKTWDKLKFTFGAGYVRNTAPATRNYFFGGARLSTAVTKDLTLGAEVYRQGATANTIPVPKTSASTSKTNGYILALGKYTVLNLGGEYAFNKHVSLQFSAGTNIDGADVFITYLGLDYSI